MDMGMDKDFVFVHNFEVVIDREFEGIIVVDIDIVGNWDMDFVLVVVVVLVVLVVLVVVLVVNLVFQFLYFQYYQNFYLFL